MQAGASFVTVEIDPERAAQAREALAGTEAEVLEGDWRDCCPPRPVRRRLRRRRRRATTSSTDLLAPGGILVKDDLTPGPRQSTSDATREALLLDPRLEATEILVTPEMACIVAVRRSVGRSKGIAAPTAKPVVLRLRPTRLLAIGGLALVAFLYWKPTQTYLHTKQQLRRRNAEVQALRAEKARLAAADRAGRHRRRSSSARRGGSGSSSPASSSSSSSGIPAWRKHH